MTKSSTVVWPRWSNFWKTLWFRLPSRLRLRSVLCCLAGAGGGCWGSSSLGERLSSRIGCGEGMSLSFFCFAGFFKGACGGYWADGDSWSCCCTEGGDDGVCMLAALLAWNWYCVKPLWKVVGAGQGVLGTLSAGGGLLALWGGRLKGYRRGCFYAASRVA